MDVECIYMKKVLFVGKFNTLYQEISTYLSRFFDVRMCESELLIGSDLPVGGKPDMVLMDLQGMGEVKDKIFYELRTNYMDIPLLCLLSETKELWRQYVNFLDCIIIEQKGLLRRRMSENVYWQLMTMKCSCVCLTRC